MLMHHHSPSFPSATAAALSPYLGGCRSARRRGSVSAAGSGGGSYAVGSPQYHPYRGPPQPQQLQQQRQLNQNQLNQNQMNQNQLNQNQMNQNQMNQNQLNQNQLVYTPSLLSRTATTIDTDNFFLDQLPTSAMSPQFAGSSFSASQQPRNRTLHQLNASPHIGGGGGASLLFDDSASILQPPPPPPQRSVSLNSAALAMLSSNSHYGSFIESAQHLDDSMSIAEQFSSQALLPPPASAAVAVSALSADQLMMQSACASATPASLMNLPLSAHHLPHSANGEIVSSEGSSGQSPGGTASAIVSAFGPF
ncbi:hypothetical protein GGH95_003469 [Coemansia sp. RSA 1836]|nr:hypothetical protein GGH95_003469 [Coemansia sp. RSA 1836]